MIALSRAFVHAPPEQTGSTRLYKCSDSVQFGPNGATSGYCPAYITRKSDNSQYTWFKTQSSVPSDSGTECSGV